MRILLTGGSGDLGGLLSEALAARGDEPAVIDLAPPHTCVKTYIGGSILDRVAVGKSVAGMACVIHIAAWHGIHETRRTKTVYDFHDLNVTGTFNVLEAAAAAGVKRFLFISSTSVADRYGVYGHSKILGEEMSRAFAHRHGMEVIILRPRAFIPSSNTAVYASFPEWAAWYARGAVHIDDVLRAVLCAVDLLMKKNGGGLASPAPIFTIDGAYDFTKEDLDTWDAEGPGSTFRKYYPEDEDLLRKYGLDPARKPKVLNVPDAEQLPGYAPQYSLKNMLGELRRFDAAGTDGVAAFKQ
jgi:nucleoside-diphosphate-sugar epimerase